ncbi:hypothetical protein GCM10010978_13670 [Compostibacillus humi]|uniref:DUF948 domain-containing protein n=1 Tax=Compostibacillus humi TaxID=1245525 RepID=A0A8J3EKG9_9BACI|nr:DUF948 domain-containing protein [Compostibacillus humi]GGH74621.1 hypothetical protein GCM10010978_13670 [Compostibacillus humi]
MTLVGIGVIIIGVALLIMAIFLGHTLNQFANVLQGVDKTVQKLPEQIDDMIKQTTQMIHEGNETLADVNDKLKQLSPLFYAVGDVGKITNTLTSSLVQVTDTIKTKASVTGEKGGGLFSTFAMAYYWFKKGKK